jgi:integrase
MSDTHRINSTLTLDEVRKVLDHLQMVRKDPHALAAFALPTLACLWRSELLNLRAEDIDEGQCCLYLGTIRRRAIPYPKNLRPIIHELMATRANGPLFDGPSHLERALRHIRRAAVELGIQKPIFYKVLRSTFMTLMAKAGVDMFTILPFADRRPRAVCSWGGHEGPARYLMADENGNNHP